MNGKYRYAALTAAAAAIFVLQPPPSFNKAASAAATVDREPKVDETFGRKATGRQSNDLAAQAVELAGKGNHTGAQRLAQRSGDAVAVKLVQWLYLKDTGEKAGYRRLTEFVDQNPDWPQAAAFIRQAEHALLAHNYPSDQVFAHFSNSKPVTAAGMFALARAKLAIGERKAAQSLAARAWRLTEGDASIESKMLAQFGSLLTAKDHEQRLWAKIFSQETNAAIRVSRRLSADHQAAAKVAQLLIRNHSGAKKSLGQLSGAMRSQPAILYALAHYHRKADRNGEAAAALLKMPVDHAKLSDPDQVWTERRLVVRDLLTRKGKKNWPTAQKLAAGHGYSSGPNGVEGEFLAGWIALRYLNDPNLALVHFKKLETITTTRTDTARSKYWLGRTYAALGQLQLATQAYGEGARHSTVFYGQLSKDALGLGAEPIQVKENTPSGEVRAKVANDQLVSAFRILARAGRQGEMGMFVWPLAKRFKTEEEMSAAASIVWDDGGPFMAVRLAKAAGSFGIDIDHWGYPVRAMPNWKPMGPRVEKALVYGLTRQESEFNATAGSHAGAKGLMQLMPGTAKLISRQYKVKYNPKLLTADPAYNARLGAAHLGDLVQDFKGSYILSLVAYNAGPRRSIEWIQRYGDPRAKDVDAIDWVESIPFTETRYYVQKVLQNTHVYRSRLEPSSMRGMSADLLRGSNKKPDLTHVAQKGPHSCGSAAGTMAALVAVCE